MSRLVPAVRQKIIETKNLLDRARAAGEDINEVAHVARIMLIELNLDFGRESLSGLLALACDCARTLESGHQSDDDNRRTFEAMESWIREAEIIALSMRASMDG